MTNYAMGSSWGILSATTEQNILYENTLVYYCMTKQDVRECKKEYYEHSGISDKNEPLFKKSYEHNNVNEGDVFPALVVRDFGGGTANLVVFHDGYNNPYKRFSSSNKAPYITEVENKICVTHGSWFTKDDLLRAHEEHRRNKGE